MSSKHRRAHGRLTVEQLEDRLLLAWTALGPAPEAFFQQGGYQPKMNVSGRVSALAYDNSFDDQNHPALFVGSASGGIWRTTDVSSNSPVWEAVSNNIKLPLGSAQSIASGLADIGALAVDPNHGKIIYAGTGEANYSDDSRYGGGILRSTDGGTAGSWELISRGPSNAFFRESIAKIIVDPTDLSGNTLFAAVVPPGQGGYGSGTGGYNSPLDRYDGLYRSTDGGKTWTKLQILNPMPGNPDPPLTITDIDYNIVPLPTPTGTGRQLVLYVAVGNPKYLSRTPHSGIYRSFQRGDTGSWQALTLPDEARNAANLGRIALAADHRDFKPLLDVVVSYPTAFTLPMLVGVFSTSNLGVTWEDISPVSEGVMRGKVGPENAVDVLGKQGTYDITAVLAPDPAHPNATPVLYVGGQGKANANPAEFQPGVIAYDGTRWRDIDVATATVVGPHVDHHALAVGAGVIYDGNDGGVWKFNPNALKPPGTWTNLNQNLNITQVNGVSSNKAAPSNVVILEGSQDNGLARDTPPLSNTTWVWKAPFTGDVGLVRFASDNRTAYAIVGGKGTNRTIIRQSLDGGLTWTRNVTTNPTPGGVNNGMQQDVGNTFYPVFAISPTNPNHVVIASNKLWIGDSTKRFPNQPVFSDLRPTNGTDPVLDGSKITALAWADDSPTGGTIYAGTTNGGLWKITGINTNTV